MKTAPLAAQEERESRTEKVAIAVTRTEKDAIDLVAKVRKPDGGVSGLLRDRPFAEVVEDGRRMLERLAEESDPTQETP